MATTVGRTLDVRENAILGLLKLDHPQRDVVQDLALLLGDDIVTFASDAVVEYMENLLLTPERLGAALTEEFLQHLRSKIRS